MLENVRVSAQAAGVCRRMLENVRVSAQAASVSRHTPQDVRRGGLYLGRELIGQDVEPNQVDHRAVGKVVAAAVSSRLGEATGSSDRHRSRIRGGSPEAHALQAEPAVALGGERVAEQ
jgi:hypothetical protein